MPVSFHHPFQESQFDIFEWYPKAQSCIEYFLTQGQHNSQVQSVAYLVNILLPFQQQDAQGTTSTSSESPPSATNARERRAATPGGQQQSDSRAGSSGPHHVALVPYIRRLVVTGFDKPAVLREFFGDDWSDGAGPIHDTERRNYLFAAKSDTWLRVKEHYDMENGQTVPFLRPLEQVAETEIMEAEFSWSAWLAMQDWMLGPRAPPGLPATATAMDLHGDDDE